MIKPGQIAEILALYKKHGWNLRRVLLSEALRTSLAGSARELFGAAEIRDSEINAVWFSRQSKPEQIAWEIRLLSESPYALMEIFDSEDDDEIRDEALAEIEDRLKAAQR